MLSLALPECAAAPTPLADEDHARLGEGENLLAAMFLIAEALLDTWMQQGKEHRERTRLTACQHVLAGAAGVRCVRPHLPQLLGTIPCPFRERCRGGAVVHGVQQPAGRCSHKAKGPHDLCVCPFPSWKACPHAMQVETPYLLRAGTRAWTARLDHGILFHRGNLPQCMDGR